ncbi:hypothetical protein [Mycobacterium marseillense]|uniref:hypothetical protein n=1 Tax=Mycobacterium marseillense TaxID=701042 RepID=UPI00119EC8A3|nr:hypothetical protein [Mycobacterium marseillense]
MTADYEADRRTREECRREVIAQQLSEFPHELAQCTCNTPSFDRDDHANTCLLGPVPSFTTNSTRAVTPDLPEGRF